MTCVIQQVGFINPHPKQRRYSKIGNAPLVGVRAWGEPTPPEQALTLVLFRARRNIAYPKASGGYAPSGVPNGDTMHEHTTGRTGSIGIENDAHDKKTVTSEVAR